MQDAPLPTHTPSPQPVDHGRAYVSAAASAVYLSPATLSAQDHLTSELLRTLQGWLLLSQPPGCLRDPTSFST